MADGVIRVVMSVLHVDDITRLIIDRGFVYVVRNVLYYNHNNNELRRCGMNYIVNTKTMDCDVSKAL